jgi:HK97 gp10 family phage protein
MLAPIFKVNGQKAISRALKELGPTIGKKPIRKGARAGAKVMAVEVTNRAPVGKTKQLRKQVKVRTLKVKRGNILIGATTGGKSLNEGDGFYGQFAEYGRRPGGWHKGSLKPRPFIVPAFESVKVRANQVAVDVITTETNKEIRKLK